MAGSRQLTRSRSSDNLPTNQSQVDIQMMSHTLTIREVWRLLNQEKLWWVRKSRSSDARSQVLEETEFQFLGNYGF